MKMISKKYCIDTQKKNIKSTYSKEQKTLFATRCVLLIFLFLLLSSGVMAIDDQFLPFTAKDMLRIARASGTTISPAGDLVAYATADVFQEGDIRTRKPASFLGYPDYGGTSEVSTQQTAS